MIKGTDYIKRNIRSSAVLTGSYVAATVLGAEAGTTPDTYTTNPNEYNQVVLYVDFTIGSLTDMLLNVEFSPDNSSYYQETLGTISGSTETDSVLEHKFTATGKYRIAIPCTDRYIKVSVKGTGTVTNSLCAIDAVLGVN